MASKYRVIVEATINQAQLQQQLNRMSAQRPVQIRGQINLSQQDIEIQVKKWENMLARMQARTPKVFASADVQKEVNSLNQMIAGFKTGNVAIEKVRLQMDNVTTAAARVAGGMRDVAHDGMSMTQMFNLAIKKMLLWAGAGTLLYGSLRQIQQGIQYIRELDKEMTDIQVVTNMNSNEIGNLAKSYNELARQLGSTTKEVARGSLEFIRQGFNIQEANKLMQASMIQAKLGNMEAAESTERLISTMNGFGMSADQMIGVVDKLTNLDNNYATSIDEISSALSRSSSVASEVGVTFDQLASYITITSAVTRRSARNCQFAY